MLAEGNEQIGQTAFRAHRGRWLRRAERIEAALVQEPWLPIGLRSLLAAELPQVCSDLRAGRRARAWRAVHRLALMSFRYGPRLLDSEAVAQLRVLDLEMGEPFAQEARLPVGKSIE